MMMMMMMMMMIMMMMMMMMTLSNDMLCISTVTCITLCFEGEGDDMQIQFTDLCAGRKSNQF